MEKKVLIYMAKLNGKKGRRAIAVNAQSTNNGCVAPPLADFSVSSLTGIIGDTLSFIDNSINGTNPIISYIWDFGDGSTSDDSSVVVHAYSDSGIFSPS